MSTQQTGSLDVPYVISFLKEKVESVVQQDNRSKSQLAKELDIGRGVIDRLLEGKVPSVENLIPFLLRFVPTSEEQLDLLAKVSPSVALLLKSIFEGRPIDLSKRSLNEIIKEKNLFYLVHAYVSSHEGTTEEEITSVHGATGVYCLREMTSKELIRYDEDSGRFHSFSMNRVNYCSSPDVVLNCVKINHEHFDIEALREHRIGSVSNITEKLSCAGIRFAREYNFFTGRLFADLMKQPWFIGNIPFFFSSFCSTMNPVASAQIDKEEYIKTHGTIDVAKIISERIKYESNS